MQFFTLNESVYIANIFIMIKSKKVAILVSLMTLDVIGSIAITSNVVADSNTVSSTVCVDDANYKNFADFYARNTKAAAYIDDVVENENSVDLTEKVDLAETTDLQVIIPETTYTLENNEFKKVSTTVDEKAVNDKVQKTEPVKTEATQPKKKSETATKTKKSETTSKKSVDTTKQAKTAETPKVEEVTTTEVKVEEVTEKVEEVVTEETKEETTESRTEEVPVEEVATEEPKKEEKVEEKKVETKTTGYASVSLSDKEIYMLAQLIYLEAGNCSYKCQCAVGSVAINLMLANGSSLSSVAHNKNMFSVASRVDSTKPSDTALKAARQIATSGTTVPRSVKCFRNNHYFSWAKPYMNIDNVYFGSF
jgi:chemotaxis protein histidine kinase CheA